MKERACGSSSRTDDDNEMGAISQLVRSDESSPGDPKRRIFVENGFWWYEDPFSKKMIMLDPVFAQCDWKMGKLAKALALGEKTLARTVTRSLGIPGKTWLRLVRVVSIRQVLKSGGKIEAVAKEFGFSQHSDLTREFKKIVGVPPVEYIRKRRVLVDSGCS